MASYFPNVPKSCQEEVSCCPQIISGPIYTNFVSHRAAEDISKAILPKLTIYYIKYAHDYIFIRHLSFLDIACFFALHDKEELQSYA